METIIKKAKKFKFSSLEYVELEDLEESKIILDSEQGIFAVKENQEQFQIYWATDTKDFLLKGLEEAMETLGKIGMKGRRIFVEFIPEAFVQELYDKGFRIVSEWTDYWKHDLDSTVVEGVDFENIRLMKDYEYTTVGQITRNCKGYSREYKGESDEYVKEWMESEHSCIFVAETEGELVGACLLSLYGFDSEKGTVLWLRELAVDPKYHGRGIGSALVARGIAWGKEQGAKRSFLAVDVENHKGIKIYERFGYERRPHRGQINMARY